MSQPILFGDIRHVSGPQLPHSVAGTSKGLPPSVSIKDGAKQGLPPHVPIKEGTMDADKQGLPQQTVNSDQGPARIKQKRKDEKPGHALPDQTARSKQVLPPTRRPSKEGLPPTRGHGKEGPPLTEQTATKSKRKHGAADRQGVSSPSANKEIRLPPKKKHKPDVLHIVSNKSTPGDSTGEDGCEGERPVVGSSLLSPAFVSEMDVLNREEKDVVSVFCF